MDVYKLILFLCNVPVFIAFGIAIYQYKNKLTATLPFIWFVIISGVVQIASMITWSLGWNNMPLLHFYIPLGTVLLLKTYQHFLNGYIPRKLLGYISVIFVGFCLYNSLFIQPISIFNSYALTAQSILLIILSLATYILFLNQSVKEKWVELIYTFNWVNSGIFIYYSSSLLLFYFGELLAQKTPPEFRISWMLHSLFISVMYCFIAIGLWKHPRK